MKKLVMVAAVLVCVFQPARAEHDAALQQTLLTALQSFDLTYGQSSPFQLDVDFAAQFSKFDKPIPGHLTFKWQAKDRWRREVEVGDFQSVEIRKGDWRYILRNGNYTPLRVQELLGLLDLNPKSQAWTAMKVKHRSEHGIEVNCIHAESTPVPEQPPGFKSMYRDVCLSVATGDVLVEEWRAASDELHRNQYTDYFDFGGHRYPRKLQLQENGLKAVTADVLSLATASFDESQFTPPPGAIARRDCDDWKPPVLIKASVAEFSKQARDQGGGDVLVALTVLTDGSTSDFRLAGSTGLPLDPATVKTLQGYKFKPAMCGVEPVVSDITIQVSFRMN